MNNNSANKSLKSFVRNAFIIISIVIAIINIFIIIQVYHRGLDDTAEHYLIEDAYEVIYLINNDLKLPLNTKFKQYYSDLSQLPKQYSLPKNISHLSIYHFNFEDTYEYLIVVKVQELNITRFIVHSFNKGNETLILNLSIWQIIGLISVLIVFIMLLMALFIYTTFNQSIYDLYNWVVQNRHADSQINHIKKYKNKGKPFVEIQSIANELNRYIDIIEANKVKEREYIKKLSHELRTPLAITQAALDILDNDSTISDNTGEKFKKIRKANDEMIQTATAILDLWQDKSDESIKENVLINAVILNAIKDYSFINKTKELSFQTDVNEKASIKTSPEMFKILINNLISNVFHHSGAGDVFISFNNGSLLIKNNLDDMSIDENSIEGKYWLTSNHGIGLSVIKTICDNYNWEINSTIKNDTYCIEIKNISNSLS